MYPRSLGVALVGIDALDTREGAEFNDNGLVVTRP
jgi:hypothetical protein